MDGSGPTVGGRGQSGLKSGKQMDFEKHINKNGVVWRGGGNYHVCPELL